jgi:AraC family transcriptional regulator
MFKMFGENSYLGVMLEDFSRVCPEGVVASSQGLGWQNVRVLQFRHSRRELIVPPLSNILVMINLSATTKVTARINGQDFGQALEEGESVIIPAGTPSEWRWPDGQSCDMLHIYLQPGFLRQAAESSDIDAARIAIEPELGVHDAHIRHIGMSLLQELESTSWAGKAYADLLATALAVHLLRKHAVESPFPPSYSGGMPKYKLRRAVDYISDKLGGELRVAEIAEEVNMSPYHFTRLFKQATGLAPHQYIMQKRIEMAKKFLVETELPIAQIALETGFQSQSRFTTLFRQITGTTPRAYRGQNTSIDPSHQTLKRDHLPYEADRYLNVA